MGCYLYAKSLEIGNLYTVQPEINYANAYFKVNDHWRSKFQEYGMECILIDEKYEQALPEVMM